MVACIKCYVECQYPSILSPNDFIKCDLLQKLSSPDVSSKLSKSPWSSDETNRMLDLVAKHQENWHEIERNMPNRTREEIILHFLQLPLKNISSVSLLEDEDPLSANNKFPIEKIAQYEPSVFSDYSNPLIQHVKRAYISEKYII